MAKKGTGAIPDETHFVNQHYPYSSLSRRDRHALRDVLKLAFPIGSSSHELWSTFAETTAFVRRAVGEEAAELPEGIIGGAIVMSYPEDQYDYLAYIAIHPDYRHRRRLFSWGPEPHHGTDLLHYVYDVMRSRVSPTRMQRWLMIEPAGLDAAHFYLRALPSNEYPLTFNEEAWTMSVAYDGFSL